jgi:hypothetical protein
MTAQRVERDPDTKTLAPPKGLEPVEAPHRHHFRLNLIDRVERCSCGATRVIEDPE